MGKPYSRPLLQYHVLLLASFCLGACLAIENITISRPLRYPETLVSTGQAFKLGFFSPGNTSNRYVGIMFNVPVMTVIWVANRDKPLNDSAGTFTISEDGNLVVLNGKKGILWSSNVPNSVASSTALLLDSGNLVLQDNSNGRIIWESFKNPSDSFVPRMQVNVAESTKEKLKLTSWSSPSDPSIGNFSTGLQARPIPQIYIWKKDKPYWRSGPWNGNLYIGIPGMNSLYLNGFDLVDDNKGSAYFTFTYTKESRLVYYVLSSSGSILEKYWIDEKQDWDLTWSSFANECDVYGKCGPYGNCSPRDSTICTCLQGFEPKDKEEWDKGNWTGGCTRKTLLQCQRNDSAGQDGYVKLKGMKVPDFAEWKSASKEDCGNLCLQNCSCMAYAYYTGIGCMHWSRNLVDIQQFSFGGADLYIRVAYSELEHQRQKKVILIASSGVAMLLVFAFFTYSLWKLLAKRRGKKRKFNLPLFVAGELYEMKSMTASILRQSALEDLPLYTYDMLADATLNFDAENRLGQGGFGEVYKGKLVDGQEIAVKRLSKSSGQGIEEFTNEVVVISKLQHRNLVRLLGCCVEEEEKMLVYEYLPKKSLDAYIFDASKPELLDWRRRALIIEGIGRGLLYLHRDSRLKIIHRDLKASNILLDEELNPKISDFGLARIFFCDQDQANTRRVVGTCGYMAPEYVLKGRFSEKSDVYSFGVLLLEIVSGRRNTSYDHHEENELSLPAYAWNLWNEYEIVELIDPAIYDPSIEMEVLRYVHVGLLCAQDSARDRPSVSAALSMLHSEIADLPLPTPPAFAGRPAFSRRAGSQQSARSINGLTTTIVEAR